MSDLPGPHGPHDKPLFLNPEKAKTATYVERPPDGSFIPVPASVEPEEPPINLDDLDHMEADPQPGAKPLKPRHREVARLAALGKRNKEIAEKLNYTPLRVGQIVATAAVQKEIDRYRNKLFEHDVMTRMKDLGQDAVNVLEELLRDPEVSASKKITAAQWLLEKLTGKAKQEVSVESNTLSAFMETLREMQQAGESLAPEPIDVTPETETSEIPAKPKTLALSSGESKFTTWVDSEL